MIKWEYCHIYDGKVYFLRQDGQRIEIKDKNIAQLGQEGWEMVAVSYTPFGVTGKIISQLFFKRPVEGKS